MNDENDSPDDRVDGPADGDAVEHLWNAAHEFLRAVRKLVEAADEMVEQQRHRPRGAEAGSEPHLRRIDIDGS